jgi:hypothetical protein
VVKRELHIIMYLHVYAAVLQSMQPLKDIIQNEVTNKLTATDQLLKERLTQLATSQVHS